MIKTAYEYGVLRALVNLGLFKRAAEEESLTARPAANNPAETLAGVLQQLQVSMPPPSPDNKTKADSTRQPQWSKPQPGDHGGEQLQKMTGGQAQMPITSSV